MAKTAVKTKGVDLGLLQTTFETTTRDWHAAERALANAQDLRDKKRAAAKLADQALRDATRTVLG